MHAQQNAVVKFQTMIFKMRSIIVCCAVMVAACSSQVEYPVYHTPVNAEQLKSIPNVLSIEYLGVGGHLFRFGDTAIMSAPSFSNPSFLRVGPFVPIATDKKKVDRYLPDVSNVSMILVGHAHYDHLMDVPYVMQKYAKNSQVYGSVTMQHAIASAVDASRIHALDSKMATAEKAGEWFYNDARTVRIMAIESMHAPHFMGINIMTGRYTQDLKALPWHAFGWKEGQTMAFLIDFLGAKNADGSERVVHRVFYQDSASEAPKGLIPQSLLAERKVDIAIITPASYQQVNNYPEYIMANTQAKHFILGHWEDFFGNDVSSSTQRFVRASNQKLFFKRLEKALPVGSVWVMPALFSTQYFAPPAVL